MIDIRNWPIDQIMQLPDEAFGQKWQIITNEQVAGGATDVWMASEKVPDTIVLWEIRVHGIRTSIPAGGFKFAIADQIPADEDAFDLGERIFKGSLDNTVEEGMINYGNPDSALVIPMRKHVVMGGKRFTVWFKNTAGNVNETTVMFLISSIPRSLGEWMLSEKV